MQFKPKDKGVQFTHLNKFIQNSRSEKKIIKINVRSEVCVKGKSKGKHEGGKAGI